VASVTRVSSRGKFVVYRPNGSIGK
jgi:hypothetical protein